MIKPKPIIFGIQRSGSTFIWNITKILFPSTPVTIHNFIKTNQKIIVTYRDFRDCVLSLWRIDTKFNEEELNENPKATFEDLISKKGKNKTNIQIIMKSIKELNNYKKFNNSTKLLFLKYEDWFDNRNLIFDKYEKFFEISILQKQRKLILDTHNIEKDKSIAAEYGNFLTYNKITQIHGNHIYTGEPGTWKSLLIESDHNILTELFKKELINWGYLNG